MTCVGVEMDLLVSDAHTAKTTKVYLTLTGGHDMRIGDRFCANATLYPTTDAPEDDITCRRLVAEGYTLVGYVDGLDNVTTVAREEFVLQTVLRSLQYRLSDRLTAAVGGEEGRLSSALLLGMRDDLSEFTVLNFRRAGASHLLALSGLHLAMIILALEWLLKLLRCPFRWRIFLLCLSAVLFLALTGFSVSMLRATFMLLCLSLSRLRGAPHDSLTPLSVFLGVTLTLSPTSVYDAGLWLTVLATFALVSVVPAMLRKVKKDEEPKQKPKLVTWLLKKLILPIVSSIIILYVLVLPMALIFGEMSLLSPLANLLLTPLTAITLVLGIVYFPLSYLGTAVGFVAFLAKILARLMYYVSGAMLFFTEKMSDMRGVVLSLRYDFVGVMLLLLVIAFVLFLLPRWKHPRRFGYVLAAWTLSFVVCFGVTQVMTVGRWQATYVSNKSNELLCLTDNRKTVLCDVTDGSYGAYREFLADARPDGTTEIEALVLTHYHNRHVSTVYKLLGDIRVRTIWLPLTMPLVDDDKAVQDEGNLRSIAALAKQRNVEVRYYLPEDGADILDTMSLDCLYFSMLKRSTHPTVSMDWSYEGRGEQADGHLFWLGASAWEADDAQDILLSATAADTLIFAAHGPVIKSTYTLTDWTNKPDTILFANGNVSAAIEPSPDMAVVLRHARLFLGDKAIEMPLP
jgi:ComEC/Rec2-related protein